MFKWLKGLFKKKPVVVVIETEVEVKIPKIYYNVRDKNGRFCKKGK